MEEYRRNVYIKFHELPPIELKTVQPSDQAGFFERLALASKRRLFSLKKDWYLELDKVDYLPQMSGQVLIPRAVNGEKLYFDGASIPLPWLISLLTLGVLRPLGVMLIGSVVHDFAYQHGYLLVENNGQTQKIPIERHIADRLLRDIIATLNNMPGVAYFGWLFVRLGWLFVKYNGKRFGGRVPYFEILIALVLLTIILYLLIDHFMLTAGVLLALYISVELLQRRYK